MYIPFFLLGQLFGIMRSSRNLVLGFGLGRTSTSTSSGFGSGCGGGRRRRWFGYYWWFATLVMMTIILIGTYVQVNGGWFMVFLGFPRSTSRTRRRSHPFTGTIVIFGFGR